MNIEKPMSALTNPSAMVTYVLEVRWSPEELRDQRSNSMPIYEYQCRQCGIFEVSQRITENALTQCPTCGGQIQRIISHTSFVLKGSGWYATDYARSSKTESSTGDTKGADDGGGNGSSSTTDTTKTPAAKSSDKSTPTKTAD